MNTREIQNKKQRILIYLLVLIPFLYFLYIMVYPLGVSVYYSLTKWKGIGSPKFVGLANYKTLVKSGDFWLVIIAFLMTLRRLRFKAFHRAVIFFPVVMSALVVGYVWRFIYNSNYGLLNMFLNFIGKPEWIRLWLDDQSIVLKSVSVPVVWQYIGLYMVILMSAISAIPQDIFECAEIDGATGFKKSIYITLPMIWNSLKVCIILCAGGTMKIYDHLVALTNGGPGRASESLAMYCYEFTFRFGNFGMGAAIAVAILVFALLISGVIQLLMGRRESE